MSEDQIAQIMNGLSVLTTQVAVLAGTNYTVMSIPTNAANLIIGKHYLGNYYPFKGYMGGIKIYDGITLSQAEIFTLASNTSPGRLGSIFGTNGNMEYRP